MEMLDYGDGIIVPKECMARTISPPLQTIDGIRSAQMCGAFSVPRNQFA